MSIRGTKFKGNRRAGITISYQESSKGEADQVINRLRDTLKKNLDETSYQKLYPSFLGLSPNSKHAGIISDLATAPSTTSKLLERMRRLQHTSQPTALVRAGTPTEPHPITPPTTRQIRDRVRNRKPNVNTAWNNKMRATQVKESTAIITSPLKGLSSSRELPLVIHSPDTTSTLTTTVVTPTTNRQLVPRETQLVSFREET